MPKFAANLTMMFNEVAFPQRFEAAAKAGFTAVEFLFPYDYPPADVAGWLARNELRNVLDSAEKEMSKLKDEFTSAEHYLLALSGASVPAAKLLKDLGVTRDKLMQGLQQVRGSQRVTDQNPEGKFQALEKYGRDLTELARRGKIDPVIGRDNEIRRVMQVLSRRTKNNPVLIGEPGVGKTAVAEGLAQRISADEVPETIKDKQLYTLDLAALVARSKYRRFSIARSRAFSRCCAAAAVSPNQASFEILTSTAGPSGTSLRTNCGKIDS